MEVDHWVDTHYAEKAAIAGVAGRHTIVVDDQVCETLKTRHSSLGGNGPQETHATQQSGLRSLTPARARAFRQVPNAGSAASSRTQLRDARAQVEITHTGRPYRTTM
jgi:hypothetical protein